MDSVAVAFPHGHLLGNAIDLALVVTANRASEDNPIAFLVADTMVFGCLFNVGSLAFHGNVSFDSILPTPEPGEECREGTKRVRSPYCK